MGWVCRNGDCVFGITLNLPSETKGEGLIKCRHMRGNMVKSKKRGLRDQFTGLNLC